MAVVLGYDPLADVLLLCVCAWPEAHICAAPSPPGAYGTHFLCTRAYGHAGDHVACCSEEHRMSTWEDQR